MSDPQRGEVDGESWPDPWPAVFELARTVSSDHWALIGGLMVQLHLRLRGEEPTRVTLDIDTLSRVEVTWRKHLNALMGGLESLGYEKKPSLDASAPLHRMTRADGDSELQVDFLIPDHVPPPAKHAFGSPMPVQAPGGRNAIERLVHITIRTTEDSVDLVVPDLVGALELKIEAYSVDSRDRARHLQDAVVLAGLLDPRAPAPPLHGDAARRLRRFMRWLEDPATLTRAGISSDAATDALLAVQEVLQEEA